MAELTTGQIEEIKQEQADYFFAVRESWQEEQNVMLDGKQVLNPDGSRKTEIVTIEIKNGCYRQILKSEGLAYWVDVYEGPLGKGYVLREEKVENGVTYHRAIHEGPERYRGTEWVKVEPPEER